MSIPCVPAVWLTGVPYNPGHIISAPSLLVMLIFLLIILLEMTRWVQAAGRHHLHAHACCEKPQHAGAPLQMLHHVLRGAMVLA